MLHSFGTSTEASAPALLSLYYIATNIFLEGGVGANSWLTFIYPLTIPPTQRLAVGERAAAERAGPQTLYYRAVYRHRVLRLGAVRLVRVWSGRM